MLGTALWFALAIALVATTLLDAAAAFGRAGLQAAADHAIETVMHDAVADYQNRLQRAVAESPPHDGLYDAALAMVPRPLQQTLAPDPGTGGPRFTLAYTVTPTTVAAPSCDPAAPDRGPDAIGWLQCSDFVQESRLSLRVDVEVRDANGNAAFARRTQYVTLRLFAQPPYSAIVGRKDGSAADPLGAGPQASPAHEGDVGGDTVSGASPPPPTPWPAGGTLIHVRYACRDGAGSCAGAAPPDPDAALRANARWTNGNAPSR